VLLLFLPLLICWLMVIIFYHLDNLLVHLLTVNTSQVFASCTYLPGCVLSSVAGRDVKAIYFSKPVTGLPKSVFYRLPKGLL